MGRSQANAPPPFGPTANRRSPPRPGFDHGPPATPKIENPLNPEISVGIVRGARSRTARTMEPKTRPTPANGRWGLTITPASDEPTVTTMTTTKTAGAKAAITVRSSASETTFPCRLCRHPRLAIGTVGPKGSSNGVTRHKRKILRITNGIAPSATTPVRCPEEIAFEPSDSPPNATAARSRARVDATG